MEPLIKKHAYTNKYLNHRGFSLIELLICIAILGIIAAPLLNHFVTAARVNVKAEQIQKETTLAQTLVEDIKGKSLEAIAIEYAYSASSDKKELIKDSVSGNYVEATDYNRSCKRTAVVNGAGENEYQYELIEKSSEPYYFVIKGMANDYDALITIDASQYSSTDQNGIRSGINAKEMPLIKEVNQEKNALFVENMETSSAIASFYSDHLNYCAQLMEANRDNPYYVVPMRTAEDIKNGLAREIIISLKENGNSYEVTMEYVYFCTTSIGGVGTRAYSVGNFTIQDSMGDIYMFYFPTNLDKISFVRDLSWQQETDVYVVRQTKEPPAEGQEDESFPSERLEIKVETNDKYYIHPYNNTTYYTDSHSGESPVNFVKMQTENRILNIKVQLYRHRDNYNFLAEDLCAEYSSAKGD